MKGTLSSTVTTDIQATPEKVWEALTNPEMIRQYLFGTNTDTDWKPGSRIRFYGTYNDHTYEDKGTILENTPCKRLSYTYWSSMSNTEDKPENYSEVTYELEPGGDTTTLSVTQDNISNEEVKAHSSENWKKVLEGLKQLVENKA